MLFFLLGLLATKMMITMNFISKYIQGLHRALHAPDGMPLSLPQYHHWQDKSGCQNHLKSSWRAPATCIHSCLWHDLPESSPQKEATIKLTNTLIPGSQQKDEPFIFMLLFISVTAESMASRPLMSLDLSLMQFVHLSFGMYSPPLFFILKYIHSGNQDSSSSNSPTPTLPLGVLLILLYVLSEHCFLCFSFKIFLLRHWSWELS